MSRTRLSRDRDRNSSAGKTLVKRATTSSSSVLFSLVSSIWLSFGGVSPGVNARTEVKNKLHTRECKSRQTGGQFQEFRTAVLSGQGAGTAYLA